MADEGNTGPEGDDAVFAQNMVELRNAFGVSQQELVKRLNALGWKSAYQTTISRIEKGDRPVRIGEAKTIARALGVDLTQMTLPKADSWLARRLASGRHELLEAERTIHRGTAEWLATQRKLESLIGEARERGVVPSEIPPQPEDDPISEKLINPVTLEDEMAAAIAATRRTLDLVLEMGRIEDDLQESKRQYEFLLRSVGREVADKDLQRRVATQWAQGSSDGAEA